MPIKIYGKGDTVSDQEFWDGRTTYNGLSQYLEYNNNDIAIKNIFNDQTDVFSFVESINTSQYYTGGVVRYSFQNEFDIKQTDFHAVTINNRTRYYVRCSPGIAVNNSHAYINKPATELACAELREILRLSKEDDELIEIKYNYDNDTFKAKVHKIANKHMEVLEFTNGTNYEIDSEPGYNTGVELLAAMHDNEFLLQYFKDTVGDDLTKIDLERTIEISTANTYYWVLSLTGELRLEDTVSSEFAIGNLTILDLALGIDSFDNTHVYSGETTTTSGDLVVAGDLTVQGTTTTVDSETVLIKDNIILLNSNQSGTPPPALQSGIEVNRGDETNYQFLFDEISQTFVIGMIGDLQQVATRETYPTDRGIAIWNDTNSNFETVGVGKIFDITNATSKADGALVVAGGVGIGGDLWAEDIHAARVYGTVWNDFAEYMITSKESNPGDVLVMTENGVEPSNGNRCKNVVGIHTNTYGYILGSDNKENKTPVGLSGRVWVKMNKSCDIGTILVSGRDGFAIPAKFYHRTKGRILGKTMKPKIGTEIEFVEMLIMMG